MILIRVRHAILLLAISLSATTGAGIWSYRVALSSGLKGPAETALFLSLAAAGVQVLTGVALFRQARGKSRELDAIADAVKYGGALPYARLARFGPLGVRIRIMLKDLADVSERKSDRIGSLTNLLRNALELVEAPVLVIGPDGGIIEASKGAREDARFKEVETGKTQIEDLVPEARMRRVLEEAARTHAAVELPGHVGFHPVYTARGEISHFLVDFSRSGIREFLSGLGERRPPAETEPAGGGLFGRFLGRFGKGGSKKPK